MARWAEGAGGERLGQRRVQSRVSTFLQAAPGQLKEAGGRGARHPKPQNRTAHAAVHQSRPLPTPLGAAPSQSPTLPSTHAAPTTLTHAHHTPPSYLPHPIHTHAPHTSLTPPAFHIPARPSHPPTLARVGEAGAEGDVLLQPPAVPHLDRLVGAGAHKEGAVGRHGKPGHGPARRGEGAQGERLGLRRQPIRMRVKHSTEEGWQQGQAQARARAHCSSLACGAPLGVPPARPWGARPRRMPLLQAPQAGPQPPRPKWRPARPTRPGQTGCSGGCCFHRCLRGARWAMPELATHRCPVQPWPAKRLPFAEAWYQMGQH